MSNKALHIISAIAVPVIGIIVQVCQYNQKPKTNYNSEEKLLYLNHSKSALYVGMNNCKLCHQKIYNSFIETGMGKSLGLATKEKSAGDFKHPTVIDKINDFRYKAFWKNDSLYFNEYRLDKNDTSFSRTEQVNYVIGSGQHTNSHLQNVNGYITQMPMTFYTQKKHWDLPPGFENGFNSHFSRKIGLECMSCHNAFPDFVQGSENKYITIPQGIDCERCHGPGSVHVSQRSTGSKIDTSKYIDYSIVNPAKLSVDLQFDICQRCHLQGNAVLKEGKSFYDYRPGKKLSDYISVFLPKYKNADDEFIMASHADRLKQSACFIKSMANVNKNALKPYKDALTCVTCHDPHVSVRKTNTNVFNDACLSCHAKSAEGDPHPDGYREAEGSNRMAPLQTAHRRLPTKNIANCVSCHMPVSGSTDIPHVSVHDHYIRKPITEQEKNKIKTFVGLYSVNEKHPDALTKAKAYLNQYAKFEQNKTYLQSARELLRDDKSSLRKNIRPLLELCFIEQNYNKAISYMRSLGEFECMNALFINRSYDNADAWACYHLAESFYNTNDISNSIKWFKKAAALAPYTLDFRNKYGTALASANDLNGAAAEYEFVLRENPKHVSAYTNLGFVKLRQGFAVEAIRLYTIATKLDPDYEPLLLNLAGYYAFMKDNKKAISYIEKVLKKNPGNQKAKMALQQMKSMS